MAPFSRLRELVIRGCRCKLTSQLRAELQLDLSPRGLRRSTTFSSNGVATPALSLKPCLSLKDLIAFGIASTIGAGIFVTTGVAAKNHTGPALFVSVIIAALCCLMNALGYSEFSSRIPAAGSAYSYTYNTMGEFAAFLMGWVLLLEYGISAAATARGFAAYVGSIISFAGLPCPPLLVQMPVLQWLGPYFSICLIAPVTVLICVVIIMAGVEESSRFNRWVTGLNIALIVFFWAAGWFFIDWKRFTPMAPFGTEGVLEGAGVLFFCFIGFDSVSTLSEEVKRPQRDIPLGIIGTLLSVTVLYIGTSVVLIGMVPLHALDDSAPLAGAFLYHRCKIIYVLVSFGAASTTFCTTFTCIMAQPRIFYRMSIDGLWFAAFHEINPNSLLPVKGIWMTGIIVALTAGLVNFDVLVRLISAGTLLSYTVVCAGVLIVRYTHQQHHTHKPDRANHHQEQQCAGSRSSSYSPPSLFSLDADDDSEVFYSGDDDKGDSPMSSTNLHHAATCPPTLISAIPQDPIVPTSRATSPSGYSAPCSASTPAVVLASSISTCAQLDRRAAASCQERPPRRSRVGEAEALGGLLTGGGDNLLSTSLLMTGPCGGLDEVAARGGVHLPLSLPVVVEAGDSEDRVRRAAVAWHGGVSPANSNNVASPYKGQGRLFVATVHILPWVFALITLLLGFALQTGASSYIVWSLAGVSAVITISFLFLHAFHELALREYFVQQLDIYRHHRRSRTIPSATSLGDFSSTLPPHFHGHPQQARHTSPFPQAEPCAGASIGGVLPPQEDAVRSSTAPNKSTPSNSVGASPVGAGHSPDVPPLGRYPEPCSRSTMHRTDHFRCPGVPLVPLAGIFLNSYLMASLQLITIIHTLVYLSVGALIYVFYGAWHSTLHTSMFVSPVADPLLPSATTAHPQQTADRRRGRG
eukprot:GHVS01037977.1.p1 GENE.GHVS01037977.1~~GHVS01037977.1.p1  ORF type:complete len:920 (-),score=113.52 GHVS01037977.1:147-2906(-)